MSGLMILIPIATGIALAFLYFFFWSVKNGDYNDPEKLKHMIIFDDQDDVDLAVTKKDEKK